jgi:hypothetical protein
MKLALLSCREVITETRRASSHVAMLWRLAARQNDMPGSLSDLACRSEN